MDFTSLSSEWEKGSSIGLSLELNLRELDQAERKEFTITVCAPIGALDDIPAGGFNDRSGFLKAI
jgi:hypothetical protein